MVRLSKWIHGEDFTRLSIFMAVSFTAMSQVWFQANLNFYKRWLNLRRCFNLIIFSKEINGIAVLNSSLYMRKKAQDRDFVHLLRIGPNHRQENRRLVGHFYDMKNRLWAVGCGWKLLSLLCSLWGIYGKENLQCVFSLQTLQCAMFWFSLKLA